MPPITVGIAWAQEDPLNAAAYPMSLLVLLACGTRDPAPTPPPAPEALSRADAPALLPFESPVEGAVTGLRAPDGWLVWTLPGREAKVHLVPDDGEPALLMQAAETPRLSRSGETLLVAIEGPGGEGPGRVLRLQGEGLQPLDLPFGHPACTEAGCFVATGRILSATSWQVLAEGAPFHDGRGGQRTVGLVHHQARLVVGVAHRDRSAGQPVEQQVAALQALEAGRPEHAAALAGPARGSLVFLDPADGSAHTDRSLPQRPVALRVVDPGWLVVVGEGTLAGGLKDAVVVARPPGDDQGWRLLAEGLPYPMTPVAGEGWLCLVTYPGDEAVVHCLSPEAGRHLVTPPLAGVRLWDIVAGEDGPRLVLSVDEDTRALPLR